MLIFDFFVLNTTNIFLMTILLSVFNLNDKKLFFLLIFDIILNGIPVITILLLITNVINRYIFQKINDNFITRLIMISIYYFCFGILLYGIYNGLNFYIVKLLLNNFIYNFIIYYLGIKYLMHKYNSDR